MFSKLRRHLGRSLGNQKGFTLTELLVVVSIVAILAGVLIPKMLPHTQNARVSQTCGNMATMKSIIEAYAANVGQGYYPITGGTKTWTPGTALAAGADIAQVLQAGGIQWTGASGGIIDSWGSPFQYVPYKDTNNNIIGWSIVSAGPDKKSGTSDDLYMSDIYPPTQGTKPSTLSGSGGTAGTPEVSNGGTMP